MTRGATAKLAGYTGFAALALFLGLALRLPELIAVGAPFALVVGLGLLVERRPMVSVTLTPDRARAIEGETVALELDVKASAPVRLPQDLELV